MLIYHVNNQETYENFSQCYSIHEFIRQYRLIHTE